MIQSEKLGNRTSQILFALDGAPTVRVQIVGIGAVPVFRAAASRPERSSCTSGYTWTQHVRVPSHRTLTSNPGSIIRVGQQ